jgi:tetratricopeptide (TPR) repeat protein
MLRTLNRLLGRLRLSVKQVRREVCLALLMTLLAMPAAAQTCQPSVMTDQARDRATRFTENLRAKRFKALDEEVSSLVKEVTKSNQLEVSILQDLRIALSGASWAEPLLLQWKKEMPGSFSAALSSGVYYTQLAHAKRGTESAANTSHEQFLAMHQELDKAVTEFAVAQQITPNSALPVAGLISVAKLAGKSQNRFSLLLDRAIVAFSDGNWTSQKFALPVAAINSTARLAARWQHVSSLLLVSEQADPQNLSARLEAIKAFNPKWGGSPELLAAVVNRARLHHVAQPQLNFLQYSAYMELANYYDFSTKEKAKAIEYYRLASELCESAAPWRGIADAAFVLQDWEARKTASTKVISYYPKSGVDIFNRGWAHEQLGQFQQAILDYEVAAELGNDWAQNNLGWILFEGKHTSQDLQRAKLLFSASAMQGNAKAKFNLESVNRALQK